MDYSPYHYWLLPRHVTLVEMAEEVRKRRIWNINNHAIMYVEYSPISKDWVRRFLQWPPELSSVTARTIDVSRIKVMTP